MNRQVSIIIPVYNSGKYLKQTLNSVQDQSYSNIEVILVDNGSTDPKTLQLLDKLKAEYKVIYTEATGVSDARNKGIEIANGHYILCLDSDDLIKVNLVSSFVSALEANPKAKIARTHIEIFGAKTGKIKFSAYNFETLLARNLMVVTSLFKKEDWERVGGFDVDFKTGFEDWEFWIRVLADGGEVATIDDYLFRYRIRRNSKNHSLSKEELFAVRKSIWDKHKKYYSTYFVPFTASFEYKLIEDSLAYKLGSFLLKPFHSFKLIK